jgi:hypothetical protein
MFKFDLGIRARDSITKFEGIIIVRSQHLTNCNQYAILPTELDKDGKRRDAEWFDEQRVEAISAEPLKLPGDKKAEAVKPGADEPLPRVR